MQTVVGEVLVRNLMDRLSSFTQARLRVKADDTRAEVSVHLVLSPPTECLTGPLYRDIKGLID
jgi:hypothetical protein